MKPRLLDLFCGQGGCSVGYDRAGFDVVGVDKNPMPNYPFEFHEADAMTYPLEGFDVIHASPPCQLYSSLNNLGKQSHMPRYDLVDGIRQRLQASGVPWVIENVMGAPMDCAIVLCGSSFGLKVRRHRLFECSHVLLAPACQHGKERTVGVFGDHPQKSAIRNGAKFGMNRAETKEQAVEAMGIDWMNWRGMTQAIPPAYTEHIGRQLLHVLERAEKRA